MMWTVKVYYRESWAKIKVILPYSSIDVNFSLGEITVVSYNVLGGGVSFASVCCYKLWKSWDAQVKMGCSWGDLDLSLLQLDTESYTCPYPALFTQVRVRHIKGQWIYEQEFEMA